MNIYFNIENLFKKKHSMRHGTTDCPENLKDSDSETIEKPLQEEPYKRWLDDLGWI